MRNSDYAPTTSADFTAKRIDSLRQLIPEAFTEGKIDFDKLRAALGDHVESGKERYTFTWAGKTDAIRLLQTPTASTLVPDKSESINWDATQNLFIEGDNLEVLKLLYGAYHGKVKLIYIDPPYNTGNDFIYPDDFRDPLAPYLQLTGQADSEGKLVTSNPETSGRFHSTWLNMMYPRLFIARQLLQNDGAICVSVDDHEVTNLRAMLNELFGEENFVATVIWHKMDSPKNSAIHLSVDHDYVLVYARDASTWRPNELPRSKEMLHRYKNPDHDVRGPWLLSDLAARNPYSAGRYPIVSPSGREFVGPPAGSYWRVSKERFEELDRDNRIWWGTKGNNRPGIKRFLSEVRDGVVPQTYWSWREVGSTRNAKQELSSIMNAQAGEDLFVTPKPTGLIKRILDITTDPDSLVVDFFAGSASTAHAVLDVNSGASSSRKFILVQLPELTGRDDFPTIADIGKERVRRVIANLKAEETSEQANTPDLGFRVFKLAPSHLKSWSGAADITPEAWFQQLDAFADPFATTTFDPDALIWEIAIKEGFPLTCQLTTAAVSGHTIYRLHDPDRPLSIHFCLSDTFEEDEATSLVTRLNLTSKDIIYLRDSALTDTAAANLALQCRLKVI